MSTTVVWSSRSRTRYGGRRRSPRETVVDASVLDTQSYDNEPHLLLFVKRRPRHAEYRHLVVARPVLARSAIEATRAMSDRSGRGREPSEQPQRGVAWSEGYTALTGDAASRLICTPMMLRRQARLRA